MAQEISQKPTNIYLIGAQCTGKTTLLQALRDHFEDPGNRNHHGRFFPRPSLVQEVVRDVMRDEGFHSADIGELDRGCQLQNRVLKAQYNAERDLDDRWYISDRSGLDPMVYARVYLGNWVADKMLGLHECKFLIERMRNSIVILCEAGSEEWLTGDEVRMTYQDKSQWKALNEEFRRDLTKHSIDFTVLRGDIVDLRERVAFVREVLSLRLKCT